jgi:hypothetical protein
LGFLRAQRFQENVELIPLPFEKMSRTISLTARQDARERMPQELPKILSPLIQEHVVEPLTLRMPWIKESFKLLDQ